MSRWSERSIIYFDSPKECDRQSQLMLLQRLPRRPFGAGVVHLSSFMLLPSCHPPDTPDSILQTSVRRVSHVHPGFCGKTEPLEECESRSDILWEVIRCTCFLVWTEMKSAQRNTTAKSWDLNSRWQFLSAPSKLPSSKAAASTFLQRAKSNTFFFGGEVGGWCMLTRLFKEAIKTGNLQMNHD